MCLEAPSLNINPRKSQYIAHKEAPMRIHETVTEIISDASERACPGCGRNLGYKNADKSTERPRKPKYHIIM
jgi:hypothetical protein